MREDVRKTLIDDKKMFVDEQKGFGGLYPEHFISKILIPDFLLRKSGKYKTMKTGERKGKKWWNWVSLAVAKLGGGSHQASDHSGSSAHSGRGGSSPPSRTTKDDPAIH